MRNARQSRSGNYAMIVAFGSVSLLGFAAMAIDFTWLTVSAIEVRAAADAGAHAAVIELREGGTLEDARAAAAAIIGENVIAGDAGVVDPNADIEFGLWNFEAREWTPNDVSPNAVRVSVRRTGDSVGGPVPLMLAPILGSQYADAAVTAQSTAALRTRDMVVVQDITGSFMDEIVQARLADIALLNHLNANSFPGDRLGLVLFTAAAELREPLQSVPDNYADLFAQFSAIDWCSDTTDQALDCRRSGVWRANGWYDLKGQNNSSNNSIWNERNWYENTWTASQCTNARRRNAGSTRWLRSQMLRCNAAPMIGSGGGTDQGAGLEVAIDHLLDAGEPTALRVIVLVTDGEPWCSSNSCKNARAQHGEDMAAWAAEENISIYGVSFNESNNADQREYLEGLVTGYGRFYDTPDETELPAILNEIARSIPVSLVQ